MTPLSRVVNNKNNKSTKFYFACIVRCIGLCYYYQGEHNKSEKPEKREKPRTKM